MPPLPLPSGHENVLPNGQVREDAARIRDKADPHLSNTVRGFPHDLYPLEPDAPGPRRGEPDDASERRRLSSPVAP